MDYSLPVFLAHAIALEEEAAERYLELADMMEAHRNDPVAALFRDMVRYSRMHYDSIVERAQSESLPELYPRDFRWSAPPETGGEEAFDYTLDAYNALLYARGNEQRAHDYYAGVGRHSIDKEVKRLAEEFAAEEAEHVAALDEWLARTPYQNTPGAA